MVFRTALTTAWKRLSRKRVHKCHDKQRHTPVPLGGPLRSAILLQLLPIAVPPMPLDQPIGHAAARLLFPGVAAKPAALGLLFERWLCDCSGRRHSFLGPFATAAPLMHASAALRPAMLLGGQPAVQELRVPVCYHQVVAHCRSHALLRLQASCSQQALQLHLLKPSEETLM